jgi:TolC family type I secretion outer membrane protein
MSSLAQHQYDTLSLRDCVDITIQNNPQLKIAIGNYESTEASYTETKSILYPQVNFQTNWTKTSGTILIGANAFNVNYSSYTLGFQLQQLIFDFGKTYSQISAQSSITDASYQQMKGTRQDLILNTHIAYFNYLMTQRKKIVAQEIVKQAEEHLNQANGIYLVGKSPEYDVIKATADLATAKVNLITAANNVRLAKLQLEDALNMKFVEDIHLRDILEVAQDSIQLDTAFSIAMKNRPEVLSSKSIVEANKSLLTAAWAANFPTISAAGGYNWRSFALNNPFDNSWNAGVTLSVPVFLGFALDAGIDKAKANLNVAEASDVYVIQTVLLDVEQQYLSLQDSKETIVATDFLVKESEETLKLAEGRYREGVGSALEITDARVSLYNAKNSYIQSLYDYQVNYTRLLRAMGNLR